MCDSEQRQRQHKVSLYVDVTLLSLANNYVTYYVLRSVFTLAT